MTKKEQFIAAARSFIGTPFHHYGRVPGVGLDCLGVVVCALKEVGIDTSADRPYSTGNEMSKIEEGFPTAADLVSQEPSIAGDVILYKGKLMHHHMGIQTELGTIVHAWRTTGIDKVVETMPLDIWAVHAIWRIRDLQ